MILFLYGLQNKIFTVSHGTASNLLEKMSFQHRITEMFPIPQNNQVNYFVGDSS